MTTVGEAKRTAQQAHDSGPVEGLARFGFAGRGVLYVIIGLLALQIAFGHSREADQHGALAAIRDTPLGTVLLPVLAVAFAGYALWRLLEALVGHRDAEGVKRTAKRLASAGRALLYLGLAVTTARFLLSAGSHDKTRPLTVRAMEAPGGRYVVGLVGAAVLVGGLAMVFRGVTQRFRKRLDLSDCSSGTRTVVTVVGTVGLAARGLVLGLIGWYLVHAAVTYDPHQAKGADAALKSLVGAPYGRVLVAAAGLGLLAFGGWSFVESRYRRV